jgi:hypothetical protein
MYATALSNPVMARGIGNQRLDCATMSVHAAAPHHACCTCRYTHGQLVEINAHSLFSKWFSESGKLVSKLFAKITELVEDESCLVFVLIDEVESLTSARKVRCITRCNTHSACTMAMTWHVSHIALCLQHAACFTCTSIT